MSDVEYAGDEASPDLTGRFEGSDNNDTPELEYGSGQADDGKKVLDADEYARIISGASQTEKLTETVNALGQTQAQIAALLQQGEERQRAANAPKPREELDEEKLMQQIEEDILSNGKAGKTVLHAIKALNKQTADKVAAPFQAALANIQTQLAEMQVKSVMGDSTSQVVMEKYPQEVQQVLAQMPVEQRMNPAMVKMAVSLVAGNHIQELAPLITGSGGQGGKAKPPTTQPASRPQQYVAKGGAGAVSSDNKLRIPVTREQLEAEAARAFWSGDVDSYARLKYGRGNRK